MAGPDIDRPDEDRPDEGSGKAIAEVPAPAEEAAAAAEAAPAAEPEQPAAGDAAQPPQAAANGGGVPEPHSALRYFDETLEAELEAINHRRQAQNRDPVGKIKDGGIDWREPGPGERPGVNPNDPPDDSRMRPEPVPCTAVGVALSGGGIRSAAVCLGALQALHAHHIIDRTDYLSTVSGGGYIGACMTARMTRVAPDFPFGNADVRDNDAVGYIRNFSNYLLPRARSSFYNLLDIAAILLRGLLCNSVVVLFVITSAAAITYCCYLDWNDLPTGNFIPRLLFVGLPRLFGYRNSLPWFVPMPFVLTAALTVLGAAGLIVWAVIRSHSAHTGNDANSFDIKFARFCFTVLLTSLFLDLQPLCVYGLGEFLSTSHPISAMVGSPVVAGAIAIALYAQRLGAFLETTRLSPKLLVQVLRVVTKIVLISAGLVLPLFLFAVYWFLTAWLYAGSSLSMAIGASFPHWLCATAIAATGLLTLTFTANAYSLHQFYKDRLTRAFLFEPGANGASEQTAMTEFKLSQVDTDRAPYHIINTALNVQGSTEANRRGRNADFFSFTRHFVGSDLTHFAPTRSTPADAPPGDLDMEGLEPRLDFGAAMAISGAALSANMGSSTVRWLSPTLALLNIRLGYWLRNPRHLFANRPQVPHRDFVTRIVVLATQFIGNFYLLLEMLNVLDEKSRYVFLSDGGHVENLGIYQLLKRGCKLIIAIDAEADPDISCASLLKLERYARIDLGIRIILPWEQIAQRNKEIHDDIDPRTPKRAQRHHGQHCALGPIVYRDGSRGVLLYFKSSLSGDEKDYVLDYKKRNLEFPHENTGDQFFTEEQFEVYRSLGYHIVDGYFSKTDKVSFQKDSNYGWATIEEARDAVREALGFPPPAADPVAAAAAEAAELEAEAAAFAAG
jgi:Patatin-like phospholipase